MANKKITDLDAKTTTTGDDLLLLVDSEDSSIEKKIKIEDINAFTKDVTVTKTDPTITTVSNEAAVNDNEVGAWNAVGLNDADEEINYGSIKFTTTDVVDGSEDGEIKVNATRSGANANLATFNGANRSVGIGLNSNPSGSFSMAFGGVATASGASSYAIGEFATSTADSSITIGSYKTNSNSNTVLIHALNGVTLSGDSTTVTGFLEVEDTENATYLAGGVRIGGNESANELDDYEEGTWDPQAVGFTATDSSTDFSTKTATYTKVGNLVTLFFEVQIPLNTDTSGVQITNLPFTTSLQRVTVGTMGYHDTGFANSLGSVDFDISNSDLVFKFYNTGLGWAELGYSDVVQSEGNFNWIRGTATYETNS